MPGFSVRWNSGRAYPSNRCAIQLMSVFSLMLPRYISSWSGDISTVLGDTVYMDEEHIREENEQNASEQNASEANASEPNEEYIEQPKEPKDTPKTWVSICCDKILYEHVTDS